MPTTVVAVLQNGVDHEERVAPLLECGSEVLPVVVQIPADVTRQSDVDHGVNTPK